MKNRPCHIVHFSMLLSLSMLSPNAGAQTPRTLADYNKAITASPQKAQVYADRAEFYFDNSNIPKAITDYRQVVKLNPKALEPRLKLAMLLHLQKDNSGALAEYDKAVALHGHGVIALAARADYFKDENLPEKALADYGRMIARQPNDEAGYEGRAQLYMALKQYANALPDFVKLAALKPNSISPLVAQGEALTQLKRTNEAIAVLMKALTLSPKSTDVLDGLGVAYWKSQSYDLAEEKFTEALAQDDETDRVYLDRARMHFEQGKRTEALEDLNKILELQARRDTTSKASLAMPEMRDILNQLEPVSLAQVYFYRSLINGRAISSSSAAAVKAPVIADAAEAVKRDPSLADEYALRGRTLLGNLDSKYGQVALLTGASNARPQDVTVLVNLAEAQVDAFDSKTATETYSRALTLAPQSAAALRGRAIAAANSATPYRAAQWLPAVADWKNYLLLKPTDTSALKELGKAQLNAGKAAEGLASYREFLKTDPENAYAHVMLGLGLALSGDAAGGLAEAKAYVPKLKGDETEQAKSDAGNATTQNKGNDTVKAIYDLIPETKTQVDGTFFLF